MKMKIILPYFLLLSASIHWTRWRIFSDFYRKLLAIHFRLYHRFSFVDDCLFFLAIVLSVILRFRILISPFGIFKHFYAVLTSCSKFKITARFFLMHTSRFFYFYQQLTTFNKLMIKSMGFLLFTKHWIILTCWVCK